APAAVGVRGRGEAPPVKHRGGAADANPYLLLTGCIAAALDGLHRRLCPPPATVGDAQATEVALPRTLAEGMAAFEADPVLQEALGPALALHLLEMGQREWRLVWPAL